jgi:type VI secretion system protein ImpL
MKVSRSTWIAIIILIVWFVLTWFLGAWLGLHPPVLYYLRAGLWIIGIAGFVGYLLLRPKQELPAPQGAAAGSVAEIDYHYKEAAKRMQAAKGIKQLGSLPAVFVLGETGAAKTSTIAKSGLEPELLAGHAYQDYVIAPTRTLNLWFARNTIFIDPSGNVIADAGIRKRLFRKFLPVRLNAVMAAKLPPSRSVVLTVDCDTFLQSGGAEALTAKARQFHSILTELSQELGSSFPVYVLFTKADKIAYFRDFVTTFTEDEAADVFGVTLPMRAGLSQGVYSEQQTRRLTDAFQDLYYSLCDKRTVYLSRENDATKLPNVYEFPREFGKFRSLLVQFLVDLCRPSQLGTSPFLRGFYFTGIRPVTVTDLAPTQQVSAIEEQGFDPGATRLFGPRAQNAALMQAQARELGGRKVPQWVFLGHLFSDVILADRPATRVTQRNIKVNFARRLLLGAACALALFMAGWWIVSYSNNRALVRDAVDAASTIPNAAPAAGQFASTESLRRLTRIRDTLATLKRYQRDGAPMAYGGLLYAGNEIREPLRSTYYALFRKLLLAPTQQTLVSICDKPEAYEARGYGYLYNTLKAYLITTNHHEKSTQDFLPPTLLQAWQKDQQASEEQQRLAQKNFEFYAEELAEANPYPQFANPQSGAVDTARDYLKRFKQEDRIYQALLTEAGKGQKPLVFNTDYPGSAATVINKYRVDPAFTQPGYDMFHKELADPERYFSGEEWVLGEHINAAQDRAQLKRDLTTRYDQDFLKTWQAYLNATSVVPYLSIADAVGKLDKMTGPESPLLRVLCVAGENTKSAPQAFQPVQSVTPPGCMSKLVGTAATPYMNGLIGLKGSLQGVASATPPDPNAVMTSNSAATQADGVVSTLALSFAADSPVSGKTREILRDPIARVPPVLNAAAKGAAAGPVNGAAGAMCSAISPTLAKYPFNPRSPNDSTLQELDSFLKPQEGQLWQFVNGPLKPHVMLAGSEYISAPNQPVTVTQPFLHFLNRAKHMSDALYKGGAQPNMTFSMQPLPSAGLDHVTLAIDGQTLSTDVQGSGRAQTFPWPGATQGVDLKVKFSGGSEFGMFNIPGLWAIWHVLDTAEQWQPAGSQYQLTWVQRIGPNIETIAGHPVVVKFLLDAQGSQVFHPQYFSGLSCVSKAVQ